MFAKNIPQGTPLSLEAFRTIPRCASLFLAAATFLGSGCHRRSEPTTTPDEIADRQRVATAQSMHSNFLATSVADFNAARRAFTNDLTVPPSVKTAFSDPNVSRVLNAVRTGATTLNLDRDVAVPYGEHTRRLVVTALQFSLWELYCNLSEKLGQKYHGPKLSQPPKIDGVWGPKTEALREKVFTLADLWAISQGARHIPQPEVRNPNETGIGPIIMAYLDAGTRIALIAGGNQSFPYNAIRYTAPVRGAFGAFLPVDELRGISPNVNNPRSTPAAIAYLIGECRPGMISRVYSEDPCVRAGAFCEALGMSKKEPGFSDPSRRNEGVVVIGPEMARFLIGSAELPGEWSVTVQGYSSR